jgi:glycine cleavage system T protein (aminomethyltransferase)
LALAGFDLVLDFGDAAAEARMCRTNCALFDFSFLECARLEGVQAQNIIEAFTGRSLKSLGEKEIFYTLRTGPDGELLADLTVWRTGADSFDVMSGRREDVVDLLGHAGPGLKITDMTASRAVFAVQGPRTLETMRKFGDVTRIAALKYFAFAETHLAGIACTVGRLGYTGEAGVEILVDRDSASKLWQALAAEIRPAGFVAADMLRIEGGFVLFSNEFRLPVWPREAGLEKFGRPIDPSAPEISLVSFRATMDGPSWPWQPSRILRRPTIPGTVVATSSCNSIAAGGILGLGYVLAGTNSATILNDPTGTFGNICLTQRPFFDTGKQRVRAAWQ